MTGGDDLREVSYKVQELISLLNHRSLELNKWVSNHHKAFQHLLSEYKIKEKFFVQKICKIPN